MTDIVAKKEEASSNMTTSDVSSPEPNTCNPGETLKKAREQAKLSTKQVADQLNLKHSVVVQIEANDFAALPGPTFIRGYLRTYGKLVNVDTELLIAGYNQCAGELEQPEARFKPIDTIKPQRNLSDPLIKYTTLIIVGALIALSIVWWQSRNGAETLSLTQNETVEVETSNGETIIAKMDLSGAEGTETTPEDNAIENNAAATTEEDSTEAETEAKTDVSATTSNTTQLTEKNNEEPEPRILAAGEEEFIISFKEECWVEAVDARGIKVLAALKKAGDQSLVGGVAPFKLMIGNANGAELIYNNEIIDLKPHTNRNGIARLTLGQ